MAKKRARPSYAQQVEKKIKSIERDKAGLPKRPAKKKK